MHTSQEMLVLGSRGPAAQRSTQEKGSARHSWLNCVRTPHPCIAPAHHALQVLLAAGVGESACQHVLTDPVLHTHLGLRHHQWALRSRLPCTPTQDRGQQSHLLHSAAGQVAHQHRCSLVPAVLQRSTGCCTRAGGVRRAELCCVPPAAAALPAQGQGRTHS